MNKKIESTIVIVVLIIGLATFTLGAVSDVFNIQFPKPSFEYIVFGFLLFIIALLLEIIRKLDESKPDPD